MSVIGGHQPRIEGVGGATTAFGLPGGSGSWGSPSGLTPAPSAPLQAEGRGGPDTNHFPGLGTFLRVSNPDRCMCPTYNRC